MSLTDIFSNEVSYGGAFAADGATIAFDMAGLTGLLVQTLPWGYVQNVTRLYDVTSTDIVLVSGRTQGEGKMARVMGPSSLTADFFAKYGNVCYADNNTLTVSAEASCTRAGFSNTVELEMNHVVLNHYGGAIAAQDMVINEQIGFIFLWMSYTVTPSA